MPWNPISTVPLQKGVLLFLVTENPDNSGIILGEVSAYEEGMFWDGNIYRPVEWCSHWMELPDPPPRKEWVRCQAAS